MRFEVGERVRHLRDHRAGEVVEARHRRGSGPEYLVEFAGGERRIDEVDLESADVGLRSYEHAENVYFRHQTREHWGDPEYGDDPSHPDGCFFCGSHSHPSDCCPDTRAVDEYWAETA